MFSHVSIIQWFQDTVRKAPQHTAVKEYRDKQVKSITYQKLFSRSYCLAEQMRGWGVDSLLLIIAHSSIKLTEWVFAAIRCGIPFMLLDESVSAEKVYSLCAEDTVILTDIPHWHYPIVKGKLYYSQDITLSNDSTLMYENKDYKDVKKMPLYQIFTSGSGGCPKRIQIHQEGILNYIDWRIRTYRITSNDVILQILSPLFDGFYSNFFTALLSGATLIFYDYIGMSGLPTIFKQEAVTQMSVTPSLLYFILTLGSKEDFQSLRHVVVGGEKCSEAVFQRYKDYFDHAVLANEYGMAENCIATTAQPNLHRQDLDNIGWPIDNTRVYLLNEKQELVQLAEMGEIYVSGVGLADSYIDNLVESEKRFVKLSHISEDILYRTGDFAVRLADGSYRYMTRMDRQVKINGCRVELDDIQKALQDLPMIDEAYVFYSIRDTNHYRIEAFFYSKQEVVISQLNFLLKNKLLHNMIPQRYYRMERPGDWDSKPTREKLLLNSRLCEEKKGCSRNTIRIFATQIQTVWANIMQKKICYKDNIFKYSVNSYTIMLVFAELCKLYGDTLVIADLYRYKTIWKLAKHVANKMG